MTVTLEPPGPETQTAPLRPSYDDIVAPPSAAVTDGSIRTARGMLAASLSTLGAAVVVGGIFLGAGGRVIACVAGVLGVGLAVVASRLRGAVATNLVLLVGVGVIGLLMMVPSGAGDMLHAATYVRQAIKDGDLLRPPVPFNPGWHAIVGWLMAVVGVVSTWTALVVRRPTVGVLLPLPLAVVAAISIPSYAQVGSGIAIVVLFAGALGVVATGQLVGGDDQRPTMGFQARRAGRSLVVIAVICAALAGAARTNVLFPKSVYNPATKAQKPHVVPPTNAPNRPLFTVVSASLGPYRTGELDIYQNNEWLYAPLDQAPLHSVGASGVIDSSSQGGISANITISGYTGAVMPTLGNVVGVIASGPRLDYQARTGLLSIAQGQLVRGYSYTLSARSLPTVSSLEADTLPPPDEIKQFANMPPAPPAIQTLLGKLHKSNPWDTFVAIRGYVLDNVTADGSGVPTAVSPQRVADITNVSKKASPFEITATIALLSRWAGIPARIGYGFQADPSHKQAGAFVITPTDAISFPEVYFTNYGWLPVTGTPKHAAANDTNSLSKTNPDAQPSSQFGVSLFVPHLTPPPSHVTRNVLASIGAVLLLLLLGCLGYLVAPALIKARLRGRRRRRAALAGPRLRLALAYAEWRDVVTDFGYRHDSDTPLAFLSHFAPDDEHTEFAWLVTRGLWGDMRDALTDEMAAHGEELSKALQRRLAAAHPTTLRLIAALSRLSLRHPFAPDLISALSATRQEASHALVAAPVPV